MRPTCLVNPLSADGEFTDHWKLFDAPGPLDVPGPLGRHLGAPRPMHQGAA